MFTKKYAIHMPLSGIATSWFERDGSDEKFAFLDYDVKKGLKWNMKFYQDEEKKNVLIEVDEQKLSFLAGQAGYQFKDAATGKILGAWVPKKRFLNMFLRAPYKLIVNEKVVATSPGEGFFKLFIPGAIRKFMARKVLSADGKIIATVSAQTTLGCGFVKVKPTDDKIADTDMANAVAVLAAICGLQDV